MRVHSSLLSFLVILCAIPAYSQNARSYRGLIRIPVDLHTGEGTRLEKGQYEMEIKLLEDHSTLSFRLNGLEKANVEGKLRERDSDAMSAAVPLVGTNYMRSLADPVGTAQERQFSKTGRAQYEEEPRDWKAAMRVYKSRDGQHVYFVFQERRGKGEWQTIEFSLLPGGKSNP